MRRNSPLSRVSAAARIGTPAPQTCLPDTVGRRYVGSHSALHVVHRDGASEFFDLITPEGRPYVGSVGPVRSTFISDIANYCIRHGISVEIADCCFAVLGGGQAVCTHEKLTEAGLLSISPPLAAPDAAPAELCAAALAEALREILRHAADASLSPSRRLPLIEAAASQALGLNADSGTEKEPAGG